MTVIMNVGKCTQDPNQNENDVHCGSQNVSHRECSNCPHLHRHSLTVSCATVWSHCQSHAGWVVPIPPQSVDAVHRHPWSLRWSSVLDFPGQSFISGSCPGFHGVLSKRCRQTRMMSSPSGSAIRKSADTVVGRRKPVRKPWLSDGAFDIIQQKLTARKQGDHKERNRLKRLFDKTAKADREQFLNSVADDAEAICSETTYEQRTVL